MKGCANLGAFGLALSQKWLLPCIIIALFKTVKSSEEGHKQPQRFGGTVQPLPTPHPSCEKHPYTQVPCSRAGLRTWETQGRNGVQVPGWRCSEGLRSSFSLPSKVMSSELEHCLQLTRSETCSSCENGALSPRGDQGEGLEI